MMLCAHGIIRVYGDVAPVIGNGDENAPHMSLMYLRHERNSMFRSFRI
jgi:hypothetical protein